MDGLSITKEVLSLISEVGTLPALLLMSICSLFVIRELKNQSAHLKSSLDEFKENSDKKDAAILKRIDCFEGKINELEKTFVPLDRHDRDYKDFKTEMKELRGLMRGLLLKEA